MRKVFVFIVLFLMIGFAFSSFTKDLKPVLSTSDSLRVLYSKPISEWPKPIIDSGVKWQELSVIPVDTTWMLVEKDPVTRLGMFLFFDPRLSSSNQISCSSCHDPDMAWQDSRVVALGHDHLQGARNTQSLLNVFIFPKLFWDGRANSFKSQMVEPLSAHHEMNTDVPALSGKLSKIAGYKPLFKKAFGNSEISFNKIAKSLEAFQRTIKSRTTKFDQFAAGKNNVFNDDEIAGLHLFRTKARCMNCHNGTYFTDLDFHNIGLTYYKRKFEDLGLYKVTKKKEDIGKFRTPSLRELERTRPWMHNGLFDDLMGVVNMYNSGMPQLAKTNAEKADSLFPKTDKLMKPLHLTVKEKEQLVAFLNTLNGTPYRMRRPVLPK
ncbi:MAG: cytochrome-c peroxidase [Chitinophagaceae bacterium]|nr:MAG: cytochrome-c peroxidase [Chitinophagaceae bacterium]